MVIMTLKMKQTLKVKKKRLKLKVNLRTTQRLVVGWTWPEARETSRAPPMKMMMMTTTMMMMIIL